MVLGILKPCLNRERKPLGCISIEKHLPWKNSMEVNFRVCFIE
jgi:hypothetical protein